MELTEKNVEALECIKQYCSQEKFSAKILSEKSGKNISSSTLTSLSKKGILERFETSPITYMLKNSDIISITNKTETTNKSTDILEKLFELSSRVESQIEKITHWMNTDDYSTDPDSQIGIYGIVDSNKVVKYVGKTTRPFNQRWEEHIELLKNGNHHSPDLQKYFDSIKRDFTKISFIVIQSLPNDIKIIDLRERYWIEKHSATILNYMRPKLTK